MLTESTADINANSAVLSSSQFSTISRIIYERCGICFPQGKEIMVKARLTKRLRFLGLANFSQYLNYLDQDLSGNELAIMTDALTTNKTSFFRESHHFEFLRSHLLPDFRNSQSGIRIWSAGCSTGEEPYSLAILLNEELPESRRTNCHILATDISQRVLATAREGIYTEDAIRAADPLRMKRHMVCVQTTPPQRYRIGAEERAMVRFAYLNLMSAWPMQGPFDAIFCRNVMIYFDSETRTKLVRRFWELIKPGGFLFVGHSESLGSSSHEFCYVEPAIYQK